MGRYESVDRNNIRAQIISTLQSFSGNERDITQRRIGT